MAAEQAPIFSQEIDKRLKSPTTSLLDKRQISPKPEQLIIDDAVNSRTIIYPRKERPYGPDDVSEATGIQISNVRHYLRKTKPAAGITPRKGKKKASGYDEAGFIELTKQVISEVDQDSLVLPDGTRLLVTTPTRRAMLKRFIDAFEKEEPLLRRDFPDLKRAIFYDRLHSAGIALLDSNWKIVSDYQPRGNPLTYRLERSPETVQSSQEETGCKEREPTDTPKRDGPFNLSNLTSSRLSEIPFNILRQREEDLRTAIADELLSYLEGETYSPEKTLDVYEFIKPLLAKNELTLYILLKDKCFVEADENEGRRSSNKKRVKGKILEYLREELLRRNKKDYGNDPIRLETENLRAMKILTEASEILSDKI